MAGSSESEGYSPGPLAGLRVVELGNFIAAPSAGRLMADFGADVVKVERPVGGDELRRWRLHGGDTSLLFRAMNRNKRSLTLDLKHPEGRDVALRLIRRCDIVLENFRPGTLERWGLGIEQMREVNPGVILTRISGYGQTGPYRDRPGFGGVAEAIGGLRHLTGYPDRPPTRVGVSLADSVAGLYAVIGALAALHRRAATGRGDTVDVALYEAVYSLMESLTPDYDAFGVERERSGSSLPGIAPSNTYLCSDGRYVVISGNGDSIFRRLMQVIGRPDLASDPDLADNAGRVRRAEALDDAISAWTGGLPHDEVLKLLDDGQIPSGPIFTAAEIATDPHFAARGMLERHRVAVAADDEREVAFPGVVPRFTEQPGRTRWLGPELGEHTDAVLAEIGIDAQRRAALRDMGVV
ncbi:MULTISPECIES: CaiB/BaiF CoA transferase family protein [unclassified Streptomyces]|uniref:CaiB/BaiF CoA transferase family protein n=1 Tax=unclassified Streptomyces TaxID=2593676 RepID=UPI0004C7D1E3|nr:MULTISPECIES: CoA transferase [unclassified Streptomyces]KOX01651.1 CoA-transferase [Streptomyces sp. NRRL WC-3723]